MANPCADGFAVGASSADPVVRGLVVVQRLVHGETSYIADDPFDGVSVGVLEQPGSSATTDVNGCFVLPVATRGSYTVILRGSDGDFLASQRVGVTKRNEGFGQFPPFLDFTLPPTSMLRLRVVGTASSEEVEISLMRATSGDFAFRDAATLDGNGEISFPGIAPGRYILFARFASGDGVFYPNAPTSREAETVGVGLVPGSPLVWILPDSAD